jgi:hypothetical protein
MGRVEDVGEAYDAAWREDWERRWRAREQAEAAAYGAVTDPRVVAVLDVLAPVDPRFGRSPIFEWPKEESPAAGEVIELAERIVAAIS